MRLFVAGFPPADAVADLRGAVDRLRLGPAAAAGAGVRMTTPDGWHLTLAFLGPVPDQRPAIEAAVARGVDHWRGRAAGPQTLRLGGGGRFAAGRSTVVWVGVVGAVDELTRLSADIRGELAAAGCRTTTARSGPT